MASIWEKAISILAGNVNSGCTYLITAEISGKNILEIFRGSQNGPTAYCQLTQNWRNVSENDQKLQVCWQGIKGTKRGIKILLGNFGAFLLIILQFEQKKIEQKAVQVTIILSSSS